MVMFVYDVSVTAAEVDTTQVLSRGQSKKGQLVVPALFVVRLGVEVDTGEKDTEQINI